MKVYIWGTGLYAHAISLVMHNDVELIGYIDNDMERQGGEFFGKQVFSPKILQSEDYDYIIISACIRYREISEQLENMGVDIYKIIQFFNYTRLMPFGFYYNETYINEERYQDVFENYASVRTYYEHGGYIIEDFAEIRKLQAELDSFYNKKTSFRDHGKIRVLYMNENECDTNYCDAEKYGFEYDSIGQFGAVSVLKKILTFKPDIIMAIDSTIEARQYYNHEHILYINDNDYLAHIYLLPYTKMHKNEIHLYYCKECYELLGKLYGDDSIYSHILLKNFVAGIKFVEQQLDVSEEFDTDIVIVAGSNSSISHTKEYIEGCCMRWMKNSGNGCLREKVVDVLYQMLDIFIDRMDETGELIEEEDAYIEEFWKLMGEDKEKLQKISIADQQYFTHLIRVLIGFGVYRRLIVKWVVESGYKVELWGSAWENEAGVEKFYKGNVYDSIALAQIYNRSKICLYTNPDLGMHLSIFEMIGSKSLCMAYRNTNVAQSLLNDSFIDGESIVFYKNRQELMDKLDFYINNTDKRKPIINRGYQIIKEQKLYREYELTQAVEKAVEHAKKNMGM